MASACFYVEDVFELRMLCFIVAPPLLEMERMLVPYTPAIIQ